MRTKQKKQSGKIRTMLAILLICLFVCGNLCTMCTEAGYNENVVDNTTFSKEISKTQWNNPEKDVVIENGALVFPKTSTADTRLITQFPAEVSEQMSKLFDAEYRIKLRTLPQGEKFILGFSLATVESIIGEPGSMGIVFLNDGGLKASIVVYDESGEESKLVDSVKIGAVGSEIEVKVSATADMHLDVTINGKKLYKKQAPIDLSGRMGLLQTGACEAVISDVNIITYSYDTPENCNISEDFENGTMNINALNSSMSLSSGYYPAGIQIEEYEGNQVLMFRNASIGYVGTVHQYSNFELSFDIPYMLHQDIYTQDGVLQTPAHAGFAVAIGGEATMFEDTWGFKHTYDTLLFEAGRVLSYKDWQKMGYFGEESFYDTSGTKGYSVKIDVKDTMLTVFMKALKDTAWKEILSYKVGNKTPLGFVQIWSTGQANFAIDNIKFVNTDQDAKVKDVEFVSGKMPGTEDWVYEPMEVKYREQAETNAFNWYNITALLAGGGIVFLVACLVVKISKKNARREKMQDE